MSSLLQAEAPELLPDTIKTGVESGVTAGAGASDFPEDRELNSLLPGYWQLIHGDPVEGVICMLYWPPRYLVEYPGP